MTRAKFLALCRKSNISTSMIHFENSAADGYYVLKNHYRWELSFRERGQEYECMGFPSESDALNYLADKLICN